jgi:precorrin-2/cobalt-factor-2 C20-methyltransferase
MNKLGHFYGIGVGPGSSGYIPIAAVEALRLADVIFHPRARNAQFSVAKQCLSELDLPEECFREIVFNMDPDRDQIEEIYRSIAETIVVELTQGKNVAYLTIGDSLTYSTYNYCLAALLQILPDVTHKTFPGITSYAAIASAFDWPLGCGKERTLILPCPDDMESLKADIAAHDVIVLMKIGHRLPKVITLLRDLEIIDHCVLGSRIGLPGEKLVHDINEIEEGEDALGYLSTMLIRREGIGRSSKHSAENQVALAATSSKGAN